MIDGVHVWTVYLQPDLQDVAEFSELLDPAELDRAERFRHSSDKHRFVVARGTLRRLLGDYLDISPKSVRLQTLAGGKPIVAGDGVHFNLSHSGDALLFAFADRPVGIDIERIAADFDMTRVVAHFFNREEVDQFERSSPLNQIEYFFRTWVRKEAYLKATGKGFAIEPADLMISPSPANRIMIRDEGDQYRSDDSFSVLDLNDFDGYVAALAVAGYIDRESVSYRFVMEEAKV